MSAIRLRSGVLFDLANPDPSLVNINDIAHALSHICRFTGHTHEFYSVAQHSVMVSRLVPSKFALWGLLHDAAEAYIGDVSSPLKAMLPDYKAIEKRMEACVWGKFGLRGELPGEVKFEDEYAYTIERDYFMLGCQPPTFVAKPPEEARVAFLKRFYELTRRIYEMDRMALSTEVW